MVRVLPNYAMLLYDSIPRNVLFEVGWTGDSKRCTMHDVETSDRDAAVGFIIGTAAVISDKAEGGARPGTYFVPCTRH